MASEFWAFVRERELIRHRRAVGLPREQWTEDEIFRTYSFTNVRREHDRVTTLLTREFYEPWYMYHRLEPRLDGVSLHPRPVALLNAAIFRYHGTIDSARALGWHSCWDADAKVRMVEIDEGRQATGERVFTSAYIVPVGGVSASKSRVVAEVVSGVWERADMILDTDSWEVARDRMCDVWCVGSFMAKEVLLDYVLATGWRPRDWETWTPVGPGARLGAGVVRDGVLFRLSEAEALEVCRELYAGRHQQDSRTGVTPWPETMLVGLSDGSSDGTLVNVPDLDLTDVQFQLCEFAKYEKARTGVGRPKRLFRPTVDDVTCRSAETQLGAKR